MPQPFSSMPSYWSKGILFGNSGGRNYSTPASGLLAYEVITSWAQLEFSQLRFLVHAEGGPESSLSQSYFSARYQSDKIALFDECKQKLDRKILTSLEILESKLKTLEKFRNKIVHWQPCSEPLKPNGITLRDPNAGKSLKKDGLRSVYHFSDREMISQIQSSRHGETAYFALSLTVQEGAADQTDLAQRHISAIDEPHSISPALLITGFGGNY